jgi:hypothetical protein
MRPKGVSVRPTIPLRCRLCGLGRARKMLRQGDKTVTVLRRRPCSGRDRGVLGERGEISGSAFGLELLVCGVPVVGQQGGDAAGRMDADAVEHVADVGEGIDAVSLVGGDDAVGGWSRALPPDAACGTPRSSSSGCRWAHAATMSGPHPLTPGLAVAQHSCMQDVQRTSMRRPGALRDPAKALLVQLHG